MLHPTNDDDWYIYVEFIICIFRYVLISNLGIETIYKLFTGKMTCVWVGSHKIAPYLFSWRNHLHNTNEILCFMILLYRISYENI
jgi:hypothetical protein